MAEPIEVTMTDPPQTYFGVPRWEPDQPYDVVVVGVPSDVGGLGHRTPAAGPGFLRATSGLFPMRLDRQERPTGWYDYVAGRAILEGVRIADAGDFPCPRWAGPEQRAALPSVYETLRDSARLLLILSGDHSVAHALGQVIRADEGLVWMDAHEDASGQVSAHPHCANVINFLDRMDRVGPISQVGLRGLVTNVRRAPAPKRRLCRTVEEVLAHQKEHGREKAIVSVDVDVLDPTIMPAVGSPMPGGWSYEQLLGALSALRAGGLQIPILEFAEFAPASDQDTSCALALNNAILRALEICLSPAGVQGVERT